MFIPKNSFLNTFQKNKSLNKNILRKTLLLSTGSFLTFRVKLLKYQ